MPVSGYVRESPAKPGEATEPPFPVSRLRAVNVSKVPQRSPLRYPGGKTWLVPHIREWLEATKPRVLIEPFAGGGIVSLTAVMEGLVDRAVMIELDPDVAAFWKAALKHGDELIERVRGFTPTRDTISYLASLTPEGPVDRGFITLVFNRTRYGGILAPGATLLKNGEAGKGLLSRWYPDTLIDRLKEIGRHRSRIEFHEDDAMKRLDSELCNEGHKAAVFADPPYTAGGKLAGNRLYRFSEIDHQALFTMLHSQESNFLMTYDCAPEVVEMVSDYGFQAVRVYMTNVHHDRVPELVITRDAMF